MTASLNNQRPAGYGVGNEGEPAPAAPVSPHPPHPPHPPPYVPSIWRLVFVAGISAVAGAMILRAVGLRKGDGELGELEATQEALAASQADTERTRAAFAAHLQSVQPQAAQAALPFPQAGEGMDADFMRRLQQGGQ